MSDVTPALWCTGFEFGPTHTYTNFWYSRNGTGAKVSSAASRSGSYGLKVAPTSGALHNIAMSLHGDTGTTEATGRFYIRFITFPSTNTTVLHLLTAGNVVAQGFEYNATTNRIRPWVRDEPANVNYSGSSTTTLDLNTWYRVDFRITRPASTTYQIEWYLDGVAQPTHTATVTATASYLIRLVFGENSDRNKTGVTGEYHIDDVAIWPYRAGASLPFPLGDGQVLGYTILDEGTHVDPTYFQDDLGYSPPADLVGTLTSSVVPPPTAYTSPHVYQATVSTTSYLELTTGPQTFPDGLTYDQARAATMWVGYSAPTKKNFDIDWILYDGTVQVSHIGKSLVSTANTLYYTGYRLAPDGWLLANFTKEKVDAYLLRYGYSSDIAPRARWHWIFFELEADFYLAPSGGDHWGWAEGADASDSWQIL